MHWDRMHHMHSYMDDIGLQSYMKWLGEIEGSLCDRKTVAVIGAGISGITMAYSLVRRGFEVEVIDAEPRPAMRTSYANGGQFSVSNSDTWCTWHNVGKGLKWMLRKDAPLLVRPLPTVSKLRWMAGFLWNTANGTQRRNTIRTIELGLWARGIYKDIAEKEKIRFDHKQNGILHIYKSRRSYESALKLAEFYRDNHVERYGVTPSEIISMEPSLKDCPDLVGGTFTPGDGMGDIHMFTSGLAKVLSDKYNVQFYYDSTVEEIIDQRSNILLTMSHPQRDFARTYAHVVICAGADSKSLGWQVGEMLNVYPVKGYSITLPLDDMGVAPKTSLLDDDAKIVTSTLGNRLRVAGTAELDGWNRDIRHERIRPLLDWVRTNLPGISTEHHIPWTGLRPMNSNMMPITRRSRGNDRVWWHTGHGHLGWTLSAATAEIVADQISEVHRP